MVRRVALVTALVTAMVCVVAISSCRSRKSQTVPASDSVSTSVTAGVPSAKKDFFRILDEVSFLPVEYGKDYCYARSFYMGLEFASRSIPSAQIIAVTKNPKSRLIPDNNPMGFTWGWHIAPLLHLPKSREPVVVDKAIEFTNAIRSNKGVWRIPDWIKEMREEEGSQKGQDAEVSVYVYPAWDYGPLKDVDTETMSPTTGAGLEALSFDTQESFDKRAIEMMCLHMAKNYEKSIDSKTSAKSTAMDNYQRFQERMRVLLPKLDARGKLFGFAANAPLQFDCDGVDFFDSPPTRFEGARLVKELALAKAETDAYGRYELGIADGSGRKDGIVLGKKEVWSDFSASFRKGAQRKE